MFWEICIGNLGLWETQPLTHKTPCSISSGVLSNWQYAKCSVLEVYESLDPIHVHHFRTLCSSLLFMRFSLPIYCILIPTIKFLCCCTFFLLPSPFLNAIPELCHWPLHFIPEHVVDFPIVHNTHVFLKKNVWKHVFNLAGSPDNLCHQW